MCHLGGAGVVLVVFWQLLDVLLVGTYLLGSFHRWVGLDKSKIIGTPLEEITAVGGDELLDF